MAVDVIVQLLVSSALVIHWFVQLVIESVAVDVTAHCMDRNVSTIGLYAQEDIDVVEAPVLRNVPGKHVQMAY